ncbi:VC0807 family protein [Nocardia sp. NPDC058705]|uniref:VC0807 family protein n=1 Tax=Nocardia sp. NPDC058705 TaxID=3346609 RepID=UPI0036B85606
MLFADTALPLAMFYALRAAGVDQWLALVLSGAIPLVLLVYRLVAERRVETRTLFTLSILLCGTAVGLFTGDPRLLVARESYLTGLAGLWMIGTLLAARPFVLSATLSLMPEATARSWEDSWRDDPTFRRAMRLLTLAWGCAFLIDAGTRLVMAYTLPLDLVPLLSTLLLVAMLFAVVQVAKRYAGRSDTR